MKPSILCIVLFGVAYFGVAAASLDYLSGDAAGNLHLPNQPNVLHLPSDVESGPHHAIKKTVTLFTNANGRVTSRKSAYTELATSLHHLSSGQWVHSSDEFFITPLGAVATNSAHRVLIASDANDSSAVNLTLPSGETLASHVFCL